MIHFVFDAVRSLKGRVTPGHVIDLFRTNSRSRRRSPYIAAAILLPFLLVLLGNRPGDTYSFPAKGPGIEVHVVNFGYHTGILIPASSLKEQQNSPKLKQALSHFRNAEWIEIGWGDRTVYKLGSWSEIDLATLSKAAFLPTQSVMHMVGHVEKPQLVYANTDRVKLTLSKRGLTKMVKSVEQELAISKDHHPDKGLYGNSRFFPANSSYHLFKMCNHWTAEMLSDAGVPLNVTLATIPFLLMHNLKSL